MSTHTGSSLGRFLSSVGRTLGNAVLAGVGMELAKVAGSHLHKRLAAEKVKTNPQDRGMHGRAEKDPNAHGENERLRAEVEDLRQQVQALQRHLEQHPDTRDRQGP